jgi:transposase
MAITLPDARQLPDDILAALRLRALRGCELGFSEADVAELLGVSRETVSRWWSAYRVGGVDGLPGDRTGRPVGSGRTLTDAQACHLQELIDHHSPDDLGIAAPLWNRKAVRELIRRECGVRMPVRTVGEYLKRWGYTAKKPRRHHRDQDPAEVKEWLEQGYPELVRKARKERAEIFWCDEAGVAADEHPGYGYARKGQRATVEVPDPHIRVNLISAISNTGKVRFMTYKQTMTGALFIVFLGRLLRSAAGKIYLIADRLRAHKCKEVEQWLAEHKDQIEVEWLPRRAPERNPDEYLNNDMKGRVNEEGLPHDKDELRGHIQSFMRRLLHWPEHVIRYFLHPDVQYAAAS